MIPIFRALIFQGVIVLDGHLSIKKISEPELFREAIALVRKEKNTTSAIKTFLTLAKSSLFAFNWIISSDCAHSFHASALLNCSVKIQTKIFRKRNQKEYKEF